MHCNICGNKSNFLFVGKVLRKYDINYFQCPKCEFLQTEEPYWLSESYADAVSDLDLGPINRAVTGSRVVESVILTSFDPTGQYVDWGGGYGVFTRLMRDIGYNFYWRDLYCNNIFAKQFSATDGAKYELLTAFEVFEHLVDPIDEIKKMLLFSDSIYFTTLLVPSDSSEIDKWWYLSFDHGQHISLYSKKSLQSIADQLGLYLVTDGVEKHILSKRKINSFMFNTNTKDGRTARLFRKFLRKKNKIESLLLSDFRMVTGWNI